MQKILRVLRLFIFCYNPLSYAVLEVSFSDFWGRFHSFHMRSVWSVTKWKDFITVSSFLVASCTIDRGSFFWNCKQSLGTQVATKDIPVRCYENMLHHEADWPFKLFFFKSFWNLHAFKAWAEILWVILSNFEVIAIFEVSPVLSKILRLVEVPLTKSSLHSMIDLHWES